MKDLNLFIGPDLKYSNDSTRMEIIKRVNSEKFWRVPFFKKADRIAIINKGNLVALDTTKKLLDRIKTKKIVFKLEEFNTNLDLNLPNVKFLVESSTTISVNYEKETINFEHLIKYLKEKNLEILDISIEEGDLEDVFLQLTKN